MDFQIRKATNNDIVELQNMVCKTIHTVCAKDYNPEQLDAWTNAIRNRAKWEKRIQAQLVELAIIDGNIVGISSLENHSYIDLMYIHMNHQHQGIASSMLERIIQIARANNSSKLESDVSITAKPLFLNKGFKEVKMNRKVLEGVELINYRMVKHLLPTA